MTPLKRKLTLTCQVLPIAEAKKLGAQGLFEDKYGDKVKVYTIQKRREGIFARTLWRTARTKYKRTRTLQNSKAGSDCSRRSTN